MIEHKNVSNLTTINTQISGVAALFASWIIIQNAFVFDIRCLTVAGIRFTAAAISFDCENTVSMSNLNFYRLDLD